MSVVAEQEQTTPQESGVGIAPDPELAFPLESGPMVLSEKGLVGRVARLAIWPLLEQFLSLLVGLVDTTLAGHLKGESETANTDAIGGAVYIVWLLGLLQSAVDTGATAMVSRATGARDFKQANHVLGQALYVSLIWGGATGLLLYFSAEGLGRMIHLKGEALELCTTYLVVMACSAPFRAIFFSGSACLRGSGNTLKPFQVLMLVNVLNAGFSLLFVYGPGPLGGYGLAGVAAGTAVAWTIGAGVILLVLKRGTGVLKLKREALRPVGGMIRRLVRVGVPNLFESLGIWGANFLVLGIVGTLGEGTLGQHLVTVQIESISYLPGWAMGIAAMTLAGQYLGAGRPDLAHKSIRICWFFAATFMTLIGMVFILGPGPLVHMMTDKQHILDAAPDLLFICGWIQISFSCYLVFSCAMRGAGDTRTCMIISLAMAFGVRLPLTWFLAVKMEYGLTGIWLGICSELFLRGLVFTGRFLHGGWTKAKV